MTAAEGIVLTIEQERERRADRGQTHTLTKVKKYGDGDYECSTDSSGFVIRGEYGVEPKAGDIVTLYLHQGSLIHGIDVNGEPLFYKTRAEQEESHRRGVAKEKARRDAEFEAEREKRDAAYDALPDIFKRRISWFRAHNPRFRQDFEPYEMSACVDAVKLAEWAQTQPDAEQAIRDYQAASYEGQKHLVPGLAYDQHSSNSFGFVIRLAFHYVTVPENVYQEHGAMVPLVGCVEYGCVHPRD